MCGIVGLAGDFTMKHLDAFKNMVYADAVRGDHGTGIATVTLGDRVDWIKRAGGPTDLFDCKGIDTVVSTQSKVLIGHNRYATTGAKNTNNAHPFEFKEIIGVHNGTITQYTRSDMMHDRKFDTDSETLYADVDYYIRQENLEYDEALAKELKRLDGAWALVFWARKAKRLCMIRNKERPLYYAWIKDKGAIVWASEPWMLFGPLARNGLELEDGKCHIVPEDTLLSFEIDGSSGSKVGEPEKRKMSGRPFALAVTDTRASVGTGTTRTTSSIMGSADRHSALALYNDRKDKHFKAPYFDPNQDKVLTKPEFQKLMDRGHTCVYCNSHKPSWNEECLILRQSPTGSPQFLCQDCVRDEEVIQIMDHMACA